MSVEIESGSRNSFIWESCETTDICVTLQGERSRFTFKIQKRAKNNKRTVSVLNGSDNETDYRFLGGIYVSGYYRSDRSPIGADADSAKAFEWFWRNPESEKVRVFLARPCRRCGRTLTTPESILRGLGPECAKRAD